MHVWLVLSAVGLAGMTITAIEDAKFTPVNPQRPLLRPGSHWFQPGNVAHSDACVSEQCLMYVQWAGPRDARLAETAKN
jgi:hypothetical protein